MKQSNKSLKSKKRKTPALTQLELLGKHLPNTQDGVLKKYLWDGTMVGRILRDESYVGTLICHKSERNKINKTFHFTSPDEQFRHENYLPPIVTAEVWKQAHSLLQTRKAQNARAASGKGLLRYGGLLRCKDCGRTFVGKRIKLISGERIEYVCDTYHRYGKEHCSSHAIDEADLDRLIAQELRNTKLLYQRNWNELACLIDKWTPQAAVTDGRIQKLRQQIELMEDETEAILMERIRDRANAERYDRMIEKREAEISAAKKQIEELQNVAEVLRSRQSKLKHDISLIEDILSEEKMSEAHLRLLVDKILVHEESGRLSLEICVKAPFRDHVDSYENGEMVDSLLSLNFDYDRLGSIIYGEFYAG